MLDVSAAGLRSRRPGPAVQAEAAKAVGGMVQFALVARALGPADYGRWVAVSLLAALLLPLTTWGANSTFLRAAATGAPPGHLELRITRLSLGSGVLAALVAAVAAPRLLPGVGAGTAAAVVFAEVGLLNLLGLRALVAQGEHRFERYRNRSVHIVLLRVGAAVVYATVWGGTGLAGWSVLYLASAALGAAPWLWRAHRRRNQSLGTAVDAADAWLFVLTTLSLRVYDDADKYLLLRTGALVDAGVYAAAYRLASYLLVPVRAVLAQSYPEMLRLGASDPLAVWQAAGRAARRSVLVGAATALPLTGAALLLPTVAGTGYAGTAPLVLALAPALGLRGAHYAYADVLTVLGHQRVRAAAQLVSFSLPLAAYVLLIPRAGAWGAVVATGLGEVATVLVMAGLGRRLLGRLPAAAT